MSKLSILFFISVIFAGAMVYRDGGFEGEQKVKNTVTAIVGAQTARAEETTPVPSMLRFETEVVDTIYDTTSKPCINLIVIRDKISNRKFFFARTVTNGGMSSLIELHDPEIKAEK